VRRNVADEHGVVALASWEPGDNLWTLISRRADQIARDAGKPDLVPHWILEGDCRVERHVPLLPYVREVAAFARLKRQLIADRVVFGQPRQQELLVLLDQGAVTLIEFRDLAIDLSPPEGRANYCDTSNGDPSD